MASSALPSNQRNGFILCISFSSLFFLMSSQLQHAEFAAEPGGRHGSGDEREGIPVGSQVGAVPGGNSAGSTQDQANEAAYQGVLHGPIGREPRRDVTTSDAEGS